MHTTPARQQIKQLKAEAEELEREARTLRKIRKMEPGAAERLAEAKRLRSEAEELEGQAKLEDLGVWKDVKQKEDKNGEAVDFYHVIIKETLKLRILDLPTECVSKVQKSLNNLFEFMMLDSVNFIPIHK